jgi:hypothetical protein
MTSSRDGTYPYYLLKRIYFQGSFGAHSAAILIGDSNRKTL